MRIDKAIKYFQRDSFKRFRDTKRIILKDLQTKESWESIHGCTWGFIRKINLRFPKGFARNELIVIAKKI